MVAGLVAQEASYCFGMVTAKLCSDSVSTILSILTVEPRAVERADEPIGWPSLVNAVSSARKFSGLPSIVVSGQRFHCSYLLLHIVLDQNSISPSFESSSQAKYAAT